MLHFFNKLFKKPLQQKQQFFSNYPLRVLFEKTKKTKTKKVYDAINENPDAVNLSPLIETVPQNKAIIEFHAIACAGISPFFYTIQHQSLYSFRKKPNIVGLLEE